MTNTNKILLGVGAIALAYYLFKDKFKGGVASTQTPSTPTQDGGKPCPKGQELIQPNCFKAPCPKICADIPKSEPRSIPNAYRLKEDFSKAYRRGNGGVALFRKGKIISALRNPYEAQSMAVGMGALTTTLDGGLPNFNMSGQVWISIPERFLEKV